MKTDLELNDHASGMANLEERLRQRELAKIDFAVTVMLSFFAGVLAAIFLINL